MSVNLLRRYIDICKVLNIEPSFKGFNEYKHKKVKE